MKADGALFLVGGETESGLSGAIDRLDFRTLKWERMTDALVPRKHHAAVVVDDAIYVIGGRGLRGPVPEVEVYDVKTGVVRDAGVLPTPRWFVSAAVYKGEIFVAGGTFGWGRVRTVEVFDLENREWMTAEPLKVARDTHLVVVGDELLALGGYAGKGQTVSTVIERYRPGAWQVIGEMPYAQSAYASAVVGSRIILLGDHGVTQTSTVLDRKPLATGGFVESRVHGFAGARHAAAVSFGNRVVVVGGEDGEGRKLATVQLLSIDP